MFWIALAAQLSLPVPIGARRPDLRAIFSADDFPAGLQTAEGKRVVYTRTTVRSDGTIESCRTEISSGDTKLDAYTCAIILRRAKFQPAKWIDGTPTYGVIRVPVSWILSSDPLTDADLAWIEDPDIDLAISPLPIGAGPVVRLTLEVAADAAGHIVACEEEPASIMHNKKQFPDLVTIACQKATGEFPTVPPIDASGKPLRSIQTVTVRFSKSR